MERKTGCLCALAGTPYIMRQLSGGSQEFPAHAKPFAHPLALKRMHWDRRVQQEGKIPLARMIGNWTAERHSLFFFFVQYLIIPSC